MSTTLALARRAALFIALAALPCAAPAFAQEAGLVTRASPHDVRATIDRFAAAVRAANWVVFTEIDHAAAAQAAGLTLRPRTVVVFGNPRGGTPAMAANPTLAIDLPLRVLVWQDDAGATQVTRSTGEDIAARIFARHGIQQPPEGRRMTEAALEGLVRRATE
ncbi:DUF302 domain-containing protein [Roseomonas fluvialis]|uniref:DUF302 domain-containing protein n=1 Tax=Roseomonas fluvialis TaxID=1750527 RepID=A0ABM7Y5D5_9PROT|nr:DUF302 domain-containing protein [Roseomonas fluvialis]BDG73137.1 hypothetical protein Rmf_30660 [Roseomonas fluvialis]